MCRYICRYIQKYIYTSGQAQVDMTCPQAGDEAPTHTDWRHPLQATTQPRLVETARPHAYSRPLSLTKHAIPSTAAGQHEPLAYRKHPRHARDIISKCARHACGEQRLRIPIQIHTGSKYVCIQPRRRPRPPLHLLASSPARQLLEQRSPSASMSTRDPAQHALHQGATIAAAFFLSTKADRERPRASPPRHPAEARLGRR